MITRGEKEFETTLAATGNELGKSWEHSFIEVSGGSGNLFTDTEPEVHLLIRSNDGEFAQGWFRLDEIINALDRITREH